MDDGIINTPRSVLEVDREDSNFRPSSLVLQFQRVFSSTVINEWKTGFNRSALSRFTFGPLPQSVSVPGFMTLTNSNLLIEAPTSFSVIDNLAITRGRHSFKTGVEVRRIHVNVADPNYDAVSVSYAGGRDTFVRNSVDSLSITAGIPVHGSRRTFYLAHFQDDFKARPNLTLNLGLRYEYYTVSKEVRDRARVFDFACGGFCPPGTPWYFPDRNNFDPRIGLAWSPGVFKGNTVFRAGFGSYHGPGQNDDVNASLDNDTNRFSLTAREAPGLAFPIEPFLGLASATGITPRSLQRDRRDLYSIQWGLSIQQQLPAGFVTQIGYVGSEGHKLFSRSFVNVIDPALGRRRLPAFGRIDEKQNYGNSNFHALQVSVHRRLARGFLWVTEYMWSHSINDSNLGGGEGAEPQNVNCRPCERGNSAQDIRHTMTSNWVYRLPIGPGGRFWKVNGPVGKLLEGWELSGIGTARTGRMLTLSVARSSGDVPDGNTANQRPNIVSGVPIIPPGGQSFALWLNPAAFAVPPRGTWGNAGRSIATGPGLVQVDLALQKHNKLTENTSLTLRVEAFNLLNRTQAGNPGTNISSAGSFGLISSGLNRTIGTGTSRQIQLALRLVF